MRQVSFELSYIRILYFTLLCSLQERSRFCVRMRDAAGRLRRQTYVKFTSACTQESVHIPVRCLAAARHLLVQPTIRTTSAFTPVLLSCCVHYYCYNSAAVIRTACASWHPQKNRRTLLEWFCVPHALADGSQHIQITEKVLMVLFALFPYCVHCCA